VLLLSDLLIYCVEDAHGLLTVDGVIEITSGWPAATRILVENLNKVDLTQRKQQLTSSGSLASITRKSIARLEECELPINVILVSFVLSKHALMAAARS